MLDLRKVSHASIFLLLFSVVKSVFSLLVKSSMAEFFGASTESDAFFAAFSIPQQVGDFLVGGIMFMMIVPVFQKRRASVGDAAAADDVSGLLNLAAVCLLGLTIAYFFAIPWIIPWLFSGFKGPKLELTIALSRYFSPSILLMGLSLIYSSFYHTHRSFLAPAIAAMLLPLSSLVALWLVPQRFGIERLVWGNLVGMALGLLFLIFLIHDRIPWKLKKWNIWNPVIKNTLTLAWPVLLAFIVGRTIPFLQKNIASNIKMDGALSLLEFSVFLINSSFVLVLSPVSTAVFPLLSKQYAAGNEKLAEKTFAKALNTIIFLVIPLWIFFIYESQDIVDSFLQYGKFSRGDAEYCANLMMIYSFMILPLCILRLTDRMFFVRHETKALSFINIAITLGFIPLYFLCARLWGLYGLAAASSAMYAVMALAGFILLKMRSSHLKFSQFKKSFFVFAVISCFSSFVFYGVANVTGFIGYPLLRLCVVSSMGFFAYFVGAYIFKSEELFFVVERVPFVGAFLKKIIESSDE